MNRILATLGCTVAGATAIYAFYPAPGLSLAVEKWRASGSYKMFRNYKVFYKDEEGQGETDTVLLIAGFAQSTYDWRKIWNNLKENNRRVVAADMLGCGFSDKPQFPTYDLAFHADLYEYMMRELGIQDVHIISCDMGNNVASELIARYEDRVTGRATSKAFKLNIKSLCVLNGRVFTGEAEIMQVEKLLLLPYVGAFISRYVYGFSLFADTISKLYGPANRPDISDLYDVWAIFRFNHGNGIANKFVYYTWDRINKAERLTNALHKTKVPRYFILGNKDPHVGDDIINDWKRYVSENSMVAIDGAGHYPHLERPQQVFDIYKKFRELIMPNLSKSKVDQQVDHKPQSKETKNKSFSPGNDEPKKLAKL